MAPPPDNDHAQEPKRRMGTGFARRIAVAREERLERRSKQPWVVKKLAIFIVIALVAYSTYVYVRLCVPMIRQHTSALGSRTEGIGLLAGFCVLGAMFWWTYLKLIFTSPGFARDYVKKITPPNYRPPIERADEYWDNSTSSETRITRDGNDTEDDILGTPYSEMLPTPSRHASTNRDGRHQPRKMSRGGSAGTSNSYTEIQSPPQAHRSDSRRNRTHAPVASRSYSQRSQQSRHRHAEPGESVPLGSLRTADTQGQNEFTGTSSPDHDHGPSTSLDHERTLVHVPTPPSPNNMHTDPKLHPLAPKEPQSEKRDKERRQHRSHRSKSNSNATESTIQHNSVYDVEKGRPAMQGRRPPSQPVLSEENRFCYRCSHVKPMRAHHCRGCGTCVLMYDHHCPWIGQCVGAHNVKFFINFLQWTPLFTLYLFISVLIICIRGENRNLGSIDPQNIVIIAISAFFSLFTIIMLLGHLRLTAFNMTTVESLRTRDMIERENAILDRAAPIWRVLKRRRIRKEWDREWGELHTEGNIWWLESAKRNWVAKMGNNVWGWFLPIGKSEGDGLTYPINPRFTQDGVWRRRRDWPRELR